MHTQTVKAATILDDAYRLIGWDSDQLDDRDRSDARMALSAALQEVWEQWWWPTLMQCQRVQFYPAFDAAELPMAAGLARYEATTDAYYVTLRTASAGPVTAGVMSGDWHKLVADELVTLDSGATFEWEPMLPIVQNGVAVGPFGPVRLVSAFKPFEQRATLGFETEPVETGERILNLDVALPWVWSRRVTPVLTGDPYVALTTYTATALNDQVWADSVAQVIANLGSVTVVSGAGSVAGVGSPEGVITADQGVIYTDTSTGALWNKVSGSGNTGWVQQTGP